MQNLGGGVHHLLTAGDGAAAEVSAGFGVDHGGNVLLRHQVGEKLLTAFHLLPEDEKMRVMLLWTVVTFLLLLLPLSIQGHQLGHVVADPSLQDHTVLIGLPEEPEEPGGSEPCWLWFSRLQ